MKTEPESLYTINYEEAYRKANEIAEEIVSSHPGISYRIMTKPEDGVYVKLYGDNENLIVKIADGMSEREMELLLAGMPVYVIYGGKAASYA